MLQILYLTQAGSTLPSVRFRVMPYVRLGEKQGTPIGWKQIPKTMASRLPFFLLLPRAKTIILQKKLLSVPELYLLKGKCSRLIFDFDDAIWTCHPHVPHGPEREEKESKAAERFANTCKRVHQIIAGNDYLADMAKSYKSNVTVIPTPIDTDMYKPGSLGRKNHLTTVGWMGTSSNLFFLPDVIDQLKDLPKNTLIKIVSDEPLPPPHCDRVLFEYWHPLKELSQLQFMDIGLMPLTDDPYTRGKCGFKILQYMACGVVPVASNIGFNSTIIEHGEDGFLVDKPEQWSEYVSRLVTDPELRDSMAAKARKKVVDNYSLTVMSIKLWQSIIT